MIQPCTRSRPLSQATGLTVETLRAWERRYGVVGPEAGRHRSAGLPARGRPAPQAAARGDGPRAPDPAAREAERSGVVRPARTSHRSRARRRAPSGFAGRMLEAAKDYPRRRVHAGPDSRDRIAAAAAARSPTCCSRCCARSGSAGTAASSPSPRNGSSRARSAVTSGSCSRPTATPRGTSTSCSPRCRASGTNWAC